MQINISNHSYTVDYYFDLLETWTLRRKDECPLCGKKILVESVRKHIGNRTCVTLTQMSASQRSNVSSFFSSKCTRKKSPTPHELTDEEKVAKKIVKFVSACYYKKKLFIFCAFGDDTQNWISGSVLSRSGVGRKLLRSAYRSGILR